MSGFLTALSVALSWSKKKVIAAFIALGGVVALVLAVLGAFLAWGAYRREHAKLGDAVKSAANKARSHQKTVEVLNTVHKANRQKNDLLVDVTEDQQKIDLIDAKLKEVKDSEDISTTDKNSSGEPATSLAEQFYDLGYSNKNKGRSSGS